MTYIFYGALTYLSYGIILSALIYLGVGLFSKDKNKKKVVRNAVILILIACVLLYWMYNPGEYHPWLLNRATKDRLLSLSITDEATHEFELQVGEDVDVAIVINDENEVEYYKEIDYPPLLSYVRLLEKELYDDDSFVKIFPREGFGSFEQIPPIDKYGHAVVVLNKNRSIVIGCAERKNSSKTLNAILDELEEMGIIAFE